MWKSLYQAVQPTCYRTLQRSDAGGGSRFMELWAGWFRPSVPLKHNSCALNCWAATAHFAEDTSCRGSKHQLLLLMGRPITRFTSLWGWQSANIPTAHQIIRLNVPPPPRVCYQHFPDLAFADLSGSPLLSSMHLSHSEHHGSHIITRCCSNSHLAVLIINKPGSGELKCPCCTYTEFRLWWPCIAVFHLYIKATE